MREIKELNIKNQRYYFFDPIQAGLFWGYSWMEGGGGGEGRPPLPKICHTYPTMMKLGKLYLTQRRCKKYMNHVTHLLSSAEISIFSPEISKFCYIKKDRYRLYFDTKFLFILTFLESLYKKHG